MGKFDLPLSSPDAQPESVASGIVIRPVLLRKGKTKLGLFGVGNVKDQRMHFELRSNRVKMFMPRDKEGWFNLLVLHQNRYVSFRCITRGGGLFGFSQSQTRPSRICS